MSTISHTPTQMDAGVLPGEQPPTSKTGWMEFYQAIKPTLAELGKLVLLPKFVRTIVAALISGLDVVAGEQASFKAGKDL